ncbi:ABC transporter substrate-binding protein [Paenibacillus swuensis]|uniref:ABC transporter substrate-binding protein n=1 Tax=Paenibacillus swuensis TaxID=1178515 RepID=UPI000838A9B2|nr:ABC transporter substrate-binding protein [Paenibacillus swuensis]
MRLQKTWLSLLIMIMILVSTAGCANNNGNGVKEVNETKPANEKTEQVPATETGTENTTNDTPVLEPVELTWYTIGPEQPKDTEEIEKAANEYLKDKINATIKFKVLDWGSFDSRSNAMMASQEPFDIIFTAFWKNYGANAVKGAYLPIDDLMEKYAPKTKALFTQEFLDGAKVNGNLYAVPVNKDKAASYGYLYRKDLADKYGFDMSAIKSPYDIEPLLKTIKEKEPTITPLGASRLPADILQWTTTIAPHALVYSTLSDHKDDNKVYAAHFGPPGKEGVPEQPKVLRDWYQKGYIRKDIATYKGSAQDDANKGQVFIWAEQLKPGKDKEVEAALKANGIAGEVAQIELTPPTFSANDITGAMMAVSKSSKNPERAMMFLELLNTDKYLNNLFNFGIEGVHYTKVSEEVIQPVEDRKWPFVSNNWILANQYINYLLPNEDPEKWKKFEAFNNSATPAKGIGFQFNNEKVKTEFANIENVIKEFDNALWWGAVDPEKYYPKLKEKLKKAGIDKYVAEVQKQYDEWRAASGKQ